MNKKMIIIGFILLFLCSIGAGYAIGTIIFDGISALRMVVAIVQIILIVVNAIFLRKWINQ